MNREVNKELYDDIKYGTNIIPEDEYIDTLITIADVASDMVVKTLGPYGKTTLLNDGTFTYPTKDGWSVLKSLRFNDAVFNVLYGVLKQISFDMVSIVGDNTTGAFVAAVKFIHYVIDRLLNKGYRQADIVDAIKTVGDRLIHAIETSKYVKYCNTEDFHDIRMIAKVSSNGNDELAEMIQNIYKETKNPNIYVAMDPSSEISYEIQTGYKLDCNPIMQKLYINTDDRTYEIAKPSMIMIFDHNVNYQEHNQIIGAISQFGTMLNQEVLILAPHFDDVISNVIGTSINSMVQQNKIPNIMLVQVPMSNNAQRAYVSDMVLLTNGQVIDYGKVRAFNLMVHKMQHPNEKIEDALLNTAQYHFETTQDLLAACAGHMRKVIVGQKYILLQEYESVVNQQVYNETIKEVEDTYKEMKARMDKSTTPLYKDYMDAYQHYTKLSGKMGMLKVGGRSELEKHYMKDIVDDAVLACRSAFEHGYVRGLNLTTLNVINNPDSYLTDGKLENVILQIFADTFFDLSLEVFKNANGDIDTPHCTTLHVDPDKNMEYLESMNAKEIMHYCIDHECGYDMVAQEIMPDAICPIINSVKSDTETIKAIVGVLSVVLTSNQFLSINRSYDRMMGLKQRQETIQKTEAAKYGAIAEEIYDRLKDKIPLFKPQLTIDGNKI